VALSYVRPNTRAGCERAASTEDRVAVGQPRLVVDEQEGGGRVHRGRWALHGAQGQLKKRAMHLLGLLIFVYLFLKLIPGFTDALESLRGVSISWIVGALFVETLSQCGYVVSWSGILDPDKLLQAEGRGRHLAARVAWAQLGGGMVVPGGTLGSMGVGAWMLHRLGMPMSKVGERQFTLMFLNTGVDAIAIVVFGTLLALGFFGGGPSLALTLGPAVLVAAGLVLVLVVANGAEKLAARLRPRRPRIASGIRTLATAVENTREMLRHRGSGRIVLGAIAYLGFDMLVLQGSFLAIDAHPVPSFAVISMCYLIGGLGGSIPLPANLGAVTGMSAMLIVFGVDKNDAIAGVVLYQSIGYVVPLAGGGLSYLFLRREFGEKALLAEHAEASASGSGAAGA
jgi:uncharacterized membrane protein YbhN (UPF0104 family)